MIFLKEEWRISQALLLLCDTFCALSLHPHAAPNGQGEGIHQAVAGADGQHDLAQMGYRIRFFRPSAPGAIDKFGDGDASAIVPEAATVCARGGKVSFSFDERFIAFHHHVVDDTQEEGALRSEVGLAGHSSNIYIYDLKTMRKVRVTKMGPNQFALYPHFRADGWLYFLVRDNNTNKHYAVASDAAIRMLGL